MDVFIADGSENVREALRELLAEVEGINLVGMAIDTYGAIERFLELACRHVVPDAVIVGMQLADGSGLGLLRFVRRQSPATRIIMLCDCVSAVYREYCIRDGADYVIDRSTELPQVQGVLEELARLGGAGGGSVLGASA